MVERLCRRRPLGPPLTPGRVIRAIKGTGGRISHIAEKLKVTPSAVHLRLKDPSQAWDRVREAMQEENERVGDLAEKTIEEVMEQRLDLGTALRAATTYLDRKCRHRGWGEQRTHVLEGGRTPIAVSNITVPVDVDKLPLEVRRALLEQIETVENGESQATEED